LRMRRMGTVIVLVLLSGCHTSFVRSGGPSETPETGTVGSAFSSPQQTSAAASSGTRAPPGPSGAAAFTLRVTDTHGLHPASIPVRVSAPVNAVMPTDAKGQIALTRGGRCRLAIAPGCTGPPQVLSRR